MAIITVDIETYSSVNLKKYGHYRYASSPDFLILLASWSADGVPFATDEDHASAVTRLIGLRAAGHTFLAHNAAFERVCFTVALRGVLELEPDEWLPPEEWDDTMAIAAELGYPKSLAQAAKALGAQPKDEAGAALVRFFCTPVSTGKAKGTRRLPENHPEKWAEFRAYCEQDVATTVDLYDRLMAKGGWPTQHERKVWLADQKINDRGIRIDTALARQAVRAGHVVTEQQHDRVRELTGVGNPGSIPQLTKWAKTIGLDMPDWQAETVARVLRRADLHPDHREVLELRQELALAAPAKFSTALGSVGADGRLRGTLAFFGAHTGRWAGRGTQVQNLPREKFEFEVDQELALDDLREGVNVSATELKRLVRPLFVGPFTVVDYSSIEAVVIAWLAGEEWVLQAFRDGRDIYVETAARMGGLTRAQGKIAVLALGYNGGANSLRAMASDRDTLPVNGRNVLLRQIEDDILFDELVAPWRKANPAIVKFWRDLDNRFRSGGPCGTGKVSFEKHGKDRLLRLPSGRFIAYRNCAIRQDSDGRERLTFASPKGFRSDTYGGRLAENVTQAVARDLLAAALVEFEAAGIPVVAHIHDEVLVEGEYPVEQIRDLMIKLPTWARGMPVNGSGFQTYRFKKD